MTQIKKAMVMGAGLGKRMRPLTDTMPKPLVPVAGKALIDRALDWLSASGIGEVVVNTHYKAEMLEAHLAKRQAPRIHISREDVLLETGGGVRKAMPMLGDLPFFVINSDVICMDGKTSALGRMREFWDEGAMDVLLLVHPVSQAVGYDGSGDFFVDGEGHIQRRGGAASAPYVFTGVQLLHPRLFAHAPAQDIFSLNTLYDYALRQKPPRIRALIHDGEWLHIGDPAGVALAKAFLAKKDQ